MITTTVRESALQSLDWRLIGPHRGGRVVAVAGDASDPMTFYFGACAGGVWKTVDGGTYWHNISDGFFNTAAIGALAVSASDPHVLYAGTGEATIRGDVSHGDGVYKSTDRGKTWRYMGLAETRHIGKIRIHPHDPDVVYVAALGHAWGANQDRGVFRSTDGGKRWEKVLYESENAGCHDLTMDPTNPRILYAAIWQTRRYPHTFSSGGPDCRLWKTTDGGDTWTDLTGKPGLPTGVLGKIGVALSPARPERVWALVEAKDGALFRSDDSGEAWERVNDAAFLRTRAWYYMHLIADPRDPETVWGLNYNIWRSTDGGTNFTRMPSQHGDEHDLWINPHDTQIMIKGDDGGACVTYTGGASWSSLYNQPTAQLYHATTDDRFPYRVYGSQQDNTAISLPSATVEGAIHERDWFEPGGGESGYIAIKPDDPDIVVASGPNGQRQFNDRLLLYNHRTGQRRNITVWPELYGWDKGAIDLKYRFQWTFPIFFSQHEPHALYVAGNRAFRSTDLGTNWEAISPDLTRHDPTRLQSSGGPITRDNTGAEVYGTIFALVESPHQPGVFWAGSDDGLVHLSEDGGTTWMNITPPDLPEWALISVIEVSPHQPGAAYLAATRYKQDDIAPYLYKTTDSGQTWTRITTGIPSTDFTRVIREDPHRRGLLYTGTETGIYMSFDDGAHWQRMGGNLPTVPIYDLIVKGMELVVATHGRSFWILDDIRALHQVADDLGDAPVYLFTPRPTVRLRMRGGDGGDPADGMMYYGHAGTSSVAYLPTKQLDGATVPRYLTAGANPPHGVVVQYYLAEEPPGGLTLDVLDTEGTVIRSFASEGVREQTLKGRIVSDAPTASGINRLLWDMRYTGETRVDDPDFDTWDRAAAPLVLPGTYTLRLQVGHEVQTCTAEILPDPRIATSHEDLVAQLDLLQHIRNQLNTVNRSVNAIRAFHRQVTLWQDRFQARTMDAHRGAVLAAAERLTNGLAVIEQNLRNVRSQSPLLFPQGLHEKFNALFDAVDSSDDMPTQQAVAVYGELSDRLDEQLKLLERTVAEDGQRFNEAIAAADEPAVNFTL